MLIIVISIILCFLIAAFLSMFLLKKKAGTQKMQQISLAIQKGARTFLNKQYQALIIFVIVFSLILLFFFAWPTSFAFIIGAVFSALAGRIGMAIATKSNSRVAWACSKKKKGQEEGFRIAFFSGAVMSFLVVGLGLAGLIILFSIFRNPSILFAFGFGASSIALFARVAGGIYTKSADIGADLVGKVEKKLQEDDPRNPAVIADQVGDNVGDVAGMGADLFESYVDSIIAAIAIGSIIVALAGSIFPLTLAAAGIFASALGLFFVRGNYALEKGILATTIFMAIFALISTKFFFQQLNLFYCVIVGLIAGIAIGFIALIYTSYRFKPTRNIAKESKRGAALNVLAGLGEGMLSTLVPVLVIIAALLISYYFASLYGVAIAAVGMLSTLGITLAADSYGPVTDNAAGITTMARLGKQARQKASKLDAIGNTTAAIGKGFAIGSAVLTALALFVAYTQRVALTSISITEPRVVSGLLLGALIPFLFSALTIKAVSSTATKVVDETRKQFRERIRKGKKPLYNKVIGIVTNSSLKRMILPACLAIILPIVVGLILGKAALGGFLASSIVCGFLLAITMANSGGALDNAKKYIEDIKRKKGTPEHEAAVVGDTVGDSLKDTAGPSLNILIKLMAIVALVFFPLF